MPRRLKSAVEIVSDIGSKAFDLQHHDELEIIKAVTLLRHVNAPMFDWLTKMLIAGTLVEMKQSVAAVDPSEDSNTGNLSTRDKSSIQPSDVKRGE